MVWRERQCDSMSIMGKLRSFQYTDGTTSAWLLSFMQGKNCGSASKFYLTMKKQLVINADVVYAVRITVR